MSKAIPANKTQRTKPLSPMEALVGKRAPPFSLTGDDGATHQLKELKGGYAVIYFYPKAMTPGCTTECRDFSAALGSFRRAKCELVAISPDPPERLGRFREKEGLRQLLLSDPDHQVATRYGAFGEKKLYGRVFQGIIRSSLLIGPDGKVIMVWPKVRVKGHSEAVLADLRETRAAAKTNGSPEA